MRRQIPIGLSTASVYPQNTVAAFEYATELGYDGVEVMVWADPVSQDLHKVTALSQRYNLPILSVHAPCLLISQRVWGRDPVAKLARSVRAAEEWGSPTVVLHPPFRWQRRYSQEFPEIVAGLEERHGVAIAVENMFPFRLDRFRGAAAEPGYERLRQRGPGARVSAFGRSIDPTDVGYANYTLDLSHTATAGHDALAMFDRMGQGLSHLHLTDGLGAPVDEHLVPGDGNQPCAEICRRLAESDFDGAVVLEVATGSAKTKPERAAVLARSLDFARRHLAR